jgi:hypothetical protein
MFMKRFLLAFFVTRGARQSNEELPHLAAILRRTAVLHQAGAAFVL